MGSFFDLLGDIGYGTADAAKEMAGVYGAVDRARASNTAATTGEMQLRAAQDAGLFNEQAALQLAQMRTGQQQAGLQQAQVGLARGKIADQMISYDEGFRAQVANLSRQHGMDTPEFKRAVAQLYLDRGITDYATPLVANAAKEIAAQQMVLARLRERPEFKSLAAVELGEDGRLYGWTGTPGPDGKEDAVELPADVHRQYAALTGNTRLLGYDQQQQQADIRNRAAASNVFPWQRGATPRQPVQKSTVPTPVEVARARAAAEGNAIRAVGLMQKQGLLAPDADIPAEVKKMTDAALITSGMLPAPPQARAALEAAYQQGQIPMPYHMREGGQSATYTPGSVVTAALGGSGSATANPAIGPRAEPAAAVVGPPYEPIFGPTMDELTGGPTPVQQIEQEAGAASPFNPPTPGQIQFYDQMAAALPAGIDPSTRAGMLVSIRALRQAGYTDQAVKDFFFRLAELRRYQAAGQGLPQ